MKQQLCVGRLEWRSLESEISHKAVNILTRVRSKSSAGLCEGVDARAGRLSCNPKILNLEPQMMILLQASPTFKHYVFRGACLHLLEADE